MESKELLLDLLDESIEESKLPFWELGEQYNLITKMKVSGWRSEQGIGLLFETFGYSAKEDLIQTLAILIATFKTNNWIKTGKIFLDRSSLSNLRESSSNSVDILGRKLQFSITDTMQYDVGDDFRLPLSILLAMEPAFNDEELFTNDSTIRKLFDLPATAQRIFETMKWNHISFEDYWENGRLPSENRDFINMIKVLSEESSSLNPKKINTTWEMQSKKIFRKRRS